MLKQIWINTGTKDITYFKNSIKAFQWVNNIGQLPHRKQSLSMLLVELNVKEYLIYSVGLVGML
jgi:hypothetical protein